MSAETQLEQSRLSQTFGMTLFSKIQNDFKDKFQKKDWSEFSLNVTIIAFLIALGLFVRLLLAYNYRMDYSITTTEIIWDRHVFFYPNGANFAGYGDFPFYYTNWIQAWFQDGWYPFTDWTQTVPGDPLYFYSYPPIFLYFLVAIWRPGMTNLWMAFPMILADTACAGVVYMILRELVKGDRSKVIAFIGGFIMALSPINIIYDGIYWLNPGPVTFFTLLSFYFVVKGKWRQVFFWLAIATMTKQNALFFTYPLFMIMLGEKVKNEGIKKGVLESVMIGILYLVICFCCSIPWIFITPIHYGAHMLFPGQFLNLGTGIDEPIINNTIQLSWSFKQLNMADWFVNFVAFGINSMFFMIFAASIIAIFLFWRSFGRKLDHVEFFEWIAIYTVLTHILMPRGVYKFYSAYYMPIILVALIGTFTYYVRKPFATSAGLFLAIGLFIGFSFWHLTIDRYFTPSILFLLCIIIGILAAIRIGFRSIKRELLVVKN
ncbi:MAG: hypothetical protein KGD59_13055 [Candidatus Heimdallarchaeota archaeon]|nr:hypothetical protein [Candidatus Heimdallarchaeota archaeon]MBY8995475.1 hypothetical protein [Candidatus Heimdallarchaeota archaeon]